MFLLILLIAVSSVNSKTLSEKLMKTDEIIRYNGYPVEIHEVRTDDGYYLTMHRIPHGKVNSTKAASNNNKEVFYIQHGLLGSSSNFVANRPRHSLAFTMADAGYDVWLGNTRGNKYSRKHAFHHVDSDEFWDFSFDDMARYDFPAMVNHVLAISNQKQLYYIGHSQGTLIAFGRLSENKQLQKKIKGMFALAPVARLQYIHSRIKTVARIFTALKWLVDKTHIRRILPTQRDFKILAALICQFNKELCKLIGFIAKHYDTSNLDSTRLPLYLSFMPEGASTKNLYHYCQLIASKKFQKYDYGWFGNLVWYFSFRPPVYDLKKVNIPIVLISGSKDIVSVTQDVQWIANQLPNVLHNIVIKGYVHLDFTRGRDAKKRVYDKIVQITKNEIH